MKCASARMTLCREGYWGPVQESVNDMFASAYAHFKAWCKRKKISCSQPLFTEKLEPWLKQASLLVLLLCDSTIRKECPKTFRWK